MKLTRLRCRRPSTSTSTTRQIFTIRRRPYDSIRAVVGLCHPLFSPSSSSSSSFWAEVNRNGSATASLAPFMDAVAGGPLTPHHEGPLSRDAVTSLRDHLGDDLVEHVRRDALLGGQLVAPPHPWMTAMWDTAQQQRYTAALLAAREELLASRKAVAKNAAFNLPRREAGLTLHEVFSTTPEDEAPDSDPADLPRRAHWRELIDAHTLILPDRSRIHEIENGPQELAITELVRAEVVRLASSPHSPAWQPELVVDVGGGNGFLTAQVSERLGCDGLVIDPHIPNHAIDCLPSYWPSVAARQRRARPRRHVLHRRKSFFQEMTDSADAVPAVSPDKVVLIAKHLCGSAIDECLRQLHEQNSLPRVLLLAPCCFNKIQLSTYCDPAFLSAVLSVHDQDTLARVTRLTDWNMTCCQHACDVSQHRCGGANTLMPPGDSAQQRTQSAASTTLTDGTPSRARDLVSMQSTARFGGIHSVVYHVPCMNAISQMVEGLVNHGRVQWLRAHGYTRVHMWQYVPDCVTPKNKCIIAVRDA